MNSIIFLYLSQEYLLLKMYLNAIYGVYKKINSHSRTSSYTSITGRWRKTVPTSILGIKGANLSRENMEYIAACLKA
ncbi:MAG: hypothetical protein ACYDIA_14715 [Candidatus Humimicrobiaceae bacterium]